MEGRSIPRKVLMTSDTIGGVWTYAVELVRGLAGHGVEVALATMGALLTADQWSEVRALPNAQVFESKFRLEWMEDPWRDVDEAGEWLLSIERKFEPDIVHLNGYCHGNLPWTAPVLMVGHSCVLSWWSAVKNSAAPECWGRYKDSVRAGLQSAHAVIAPSQVMCEFMARTYGPLTRTAVIPNGREPLATLPRERKDVILAAGRLWDESKNIRVLAQVAHRLPWPVCVAGDIHHPNGTSTRFENVHLLGRLSSREMRDWYSRVSIYALPARYEPFGLSALEAAGAGCALVLGDIATLREVWGDAALFVHPDDHEALAETLLALINDEKLRRHYGERAFEQSRRYTPERMIEGYLGMYEQLLQSCVSQDLAEVCA